MCCKAKVENVAEMGGGCWAVGARRNWEQSAS